MLENLVRDFQVLRRADVLIAKIWLSVAARRLALFIFAALIAVFGLAMANVAGFFALQPGLGDVGAAASMAAADLVIAVVVVTIALKSRPGPELELAYDLRKMAAESLATDARDMKLGLEAIGREIGEVRAALAGFVQNPLDAAAQKLLVPAAISIMRSLRHKKSQS